MKNKEVPLKCPHCSYSWTYKGKRKHGATCPDCKGLVKIEASP